MSKKTFINPFVILYLMIAINNVNQAFAEELTIGDDQIVILSDILRYFPDKELAIFEGKVEATQNDTKLFCDKMEVDFLKASLKLNASNQGGKKIKKIYVQGNVIMQTSQERATSLRGELDVKKGMLYLFDEVKLHQSNNILTGDKLTYNTITKESLVTSNKSAKNPKRVYGIFTPKGKDK